jgi:ubiquinone biosynthesis protein
VWFAAFSKQILRVRLMGDFGSTIAISEQANRSTKLTGRGILVAATVMQLCLLMAASSSIRSIVRWGGVQNVLGTLCRAILRSAGGGFVKIGQLLATRLDLLDPEFARPLAELHDKARNRSLAKSLAGVSRATAHDLVARYGFLEESSSIGGSVAQIYSALDRPTGKVVVIKIIRADTRAQTFYDIVVFRRFVRFVARFRVVCRIPIVQAMDSVFRRVVFQFNLVREARFQAQLGAWLTEDGVRIPNVGSVVHKDAIAMEWMPELRPIDSVTQSQARKELALRALRLLSKMIFVYGWIHCDFHPGNVMTDGHGRLVLLDFGLNAELNGANRRLLAKFFLALSANDPVSGVEVILDVAQRIGPTLSVQHLELDISALFQENSRKPASEFSLVDFVSKLFMIQARHGITSTTSFTLPIIALTVFEGRLKAWYPDIDFQRETMPYVLDALAGTDYRTNISESDRPSVLYRRPSCDNLMSPPVAPET